MRCYAVTENKRPLVPIDLPTPEPTGTQVLVRVTHCGVCHSDLHLWEGGYDLGEGQRLALADRGVSLPMVMGHEILGTVAKLGPGARDAGLKEGVPYAVFPWVGCGECAACLSEDDNFCGKPRSLGIHQYGGYGEYVLAPHPRHLVDVSGLDPAVAATWSCSGITVFSAIRKVMPLAADEPVVLVGAGGLGLAAIGVLKAMGHRRIVVADIAETKRAAALAAGATDVVDASGAPSDVAGRIVASCGGPVAAVIDLVNGTATARAAYEALRKGGRMVQVGLFGGDIRVPLPMLTIRALVIQGSHLGNPKELRELVALARAGRLDPIPVRTAPIARINDVLAELAAGKVVGRVVVTHEA
jgi:alcohol dehydrogenase/propanol-preferring alcohol dehydrogenase